MKFLKLTFPEAETGKVTAIVEAADPLDWAMDSGYGRFEKAIEIVIDSQKCQPLVDDLQSSLSTSTDWRLTVIPIEATLPRPEKQTEEEKPKGSPPATLRETLRQKLLADTKFDINFIILTLLSAIVATIGLNGDSVTIVIAAMVIAPLLSPVLALALGTALGDWELIRQSTRTALLGFLIGFGTAYLIAIFMPLDLGSTELIDRTILGPAIIVLAIASGAAAALSLTTGSSSALVGVMVAVALLPPSVASALYLGAGEYENSSKAAVLLGINVTSVLIAAQIVYAWKGIRPHKWSDQERARRSVRISIALWSLTLVALVFLAAKYFDFG